MDAHGSIDPGWKGWVNANNLRADGPKAQKLYDARDAANAALRVSRTGFIARLKLDLETSLENGVFAFNAVGYESPQDRIVATLQDESASPVPIARKLSRHW